MKKEKRLDPRVKRTRQLLKDALISLIMENDYNLITVRDITERATLNRVTFYLHYSDKDDLMKQSTDELLEELTDSVASIGEVSESFDFRGTQPHPTFVQLFEQIGQHSDFYLVMLKGKVMPHFSLKVMSILTEYISSGLASVEPDDQGLTVQREIVERYIGSAFFGVIMWWLENDLPYTAKQMAAKLMRLANKGPYKEIPS
ncbi:TetR family transcriptional regulator [Scopulibacillus darangshiensis]|uniref:TetR family transcriptional regulator n=1 Tax=Scopulibacillus darangshiensis TaxID=442528 RepID=A0A4R2P542_9BACL|nr:TetR/AcrR family transcriptional regulator [Scopulibacillus darangshiensis]TCP29204.1 TetR family transcriptional regulator [Scopulibacillus darangshiensis]